MADTTLPLPGLSPVLGKSVFARFDGGLLSSDAGVLALRAVEKQLGVAECLAGCIEDLRRQDQVTHQLADMVLFKEWFEGTIARADKMLEQLIVLTIKVQPNVFYASIDDHVLEFMSFAPKGMLP